MAHDEEILRKLPLRTRMHTHNVFIFHRKTIPLCAGNMLLVDESMRDTKGRLALLDFGLMAELGTKEREGMVSVEGRTG